MRGDAIMMAHRYTIFGGLHPAGICLVQGVLFVLDEVHYIVQFLGEEIQFIRNLFFIAFGGVGQFLVDFGDLGDEVAQTVSNFVDDEVDIIRLVGEAGLPQTVGVIIFKNMFFGGWLIPEAHVLLIGGLIIASLGFESFVLVFVLVFEGIELFNLLFIVLESGVQVLIFLAEFDELFVQVGGFFLFVRGLPPIQHPLKSLLSSQIITNEPKSIIIQQILFLQYTSIYSHTQIIFHILFVLLWLGCLPHPVGPIKGGNDGIAY